jgi:hypothetical protein
LMISARVAGVPMPFASFSRSRIAALYQSKDELTRRDSHQRFCVIHEVPAGH